MDTREKFLEYKNITEEIIRLIENDLDTDELMRRRDLILKSIFEKEVDKKDVKEIYNELNIANIDTILRDAIKQEQEKVKEELKEIHTRKRANSTYSNHLSGVHFLNKHI